MPQFLIDFFNLVFIQPVTNGLVVFYDLFVQIGLPGAFGFSIIAITVLIRILMHPFFRQQMDTAKKMREIKPQLDALSKKHKKDPQTLQKEQMKLYQEAGINPAGGCLFALLQIPLIYGLYHTLQLFLTYDRDGKIVQEINDKLYHPALQISSIDPTFFVYNLAVAPAQAGGQWYYYLVPVITAVLQYFQTKVTMPQFQNDPKKDEKNDSQTKKGEKSKEKEEPSTADEFQRAMSTQMKYIFPVMIGYFSYTLPLGLSLYWNTFSLFSIIQHYIDERNVQKLVKAETK